MLTAYQEYRYCEARLNGQLGPRQGWGQAQTLEHYWRTCNVQAAAERALRAATTLAQRQVMESLASVDLWRQLPAGIWAYYLRNEY